MLSELTVVALTLFGEGSVCSRLELAAIARVIEVRAQDEQTSFRRVCLKEGQFSCWNDSAGKRRMLRQYKEGCLNTPAGLRCVEIAIQLVNSELQPVMPRFKWYYNPLRCYPRWAQLGKKSIVQEHHVFLYN